MIGQRSLAMPWSFVSKITNSKHPAKKTAGKQITNKFQIPIFHPSTSRLSTGDQNLPQAETLFDIWYLLFGI